MLRTLRVHGPTRGVSGYDHHTRAFVRELVAAGVRVEVEELRDWTSPELESEESDLRVGMDSGVAPQVVLHSTLPHQVRPEPGLINVSLTMFEADSIPASWVEHSRDADVIVVPTQSSLDAWIASGVPMEKMRTCPLGVDADRFDGSAEPLPLTLKTGEPVSGRRHRFLNVGEVRPRKNQLGLLRAWLRATDPGDDAVLLLKAGYHQPLDRLQFGGDLVRALKESGLGFSDGAPVVFLEELLPSSAMPSLFTAATHYISMSCGEGWDLAMMEAGASGLSLVAPRHSAYLHYLNDDLADLIDAPLQRARIEGALSWKEDALFSGRCWWPPDEDHAVEVIRRVLDGKGRKPAPEVFRTEHTWTRATERLMEVLDEAGRMPVPTRPRYFGSPPPEAEPGGDVTDLTLVYTAPNGTLTSDPGGGEPLRIYLGRASLLASPDVDERLAEHGIRSILNVAYDVDDAVPNPPLPVTSGPAQVLRTGGLRERRRYLYQSAKVGLVSGYGNSDGTLLAALYMADQLACFPPHPPEPPLVNEMVRGNLLIHCHSGGSRSVLVGALYVYFKFGVQLGIEADADFSLVLQRMVDLRAPHSGGVLPRPSVCRAAYRLANRFRAVFPYPAELSSSQEPGSAS